MHGYDASTYGQGFADIYDDWYPSTTATDQAIDRLTELAASGRVLELGVGTGKLAIPLAARGLEVWGIDSSPAMLERLAVKPGAARVNAVLGDMGAPLPAGPFRLVFIANNTLFNLVTADAQADALGHVAEVLERGGRLVIEAFVPNDPPGSISGIDVRQVAADRVVLSVHRTDPRRQVAEGSYVELTESGGVRLRPWSIRYTTPGQLDELAHRAGFEREHRYGGWDWSPFDDDSAHHVSIYRRSV